MNYDQFYQNGGTYVIPTEVFNELIDENKDKLYQIIYAGLQFDVNKGVYDAFNNLIEENKKLKEELQKADSITQSCIFNGKKESELNFRQSLNLVKELKQENQQLEHNWNELKKWLREVEEVKYYLTCYQRYEVFINKIINKMQELEEGGNNE